LTKQQIVIKPNNSNVVRKAESLLKARYSLSDLAIKIITTVISIIQKDDEDFKLYILRIQDFKELTNTKGKLGGSAYEQIKRACDELLTKKIEFDEGLEVGFLLSRWIASAEYFAGAGEIEIEISQKLRPLLLQLKQGNYLNYELGNILALRSAYVIRLYELLKHEFNKVARYKNYKAIVYELNINQLRQDFKIPDSYRFNDIKKNIVDKAVNQFSEHTDIQISYESKKKGKKVIAIEFTISENKRLLSSLKTLKTFVEFMRKNYVNKSIKDGLLIAEDGTILDTINIKPISGFNAQKIWENWYELAKKNELKIVKEK